MDLEITIDASQLGDIAKALDPERTKVVLNGAAKALAATGKAHVLDLAAERLKSRHHLYAPKVKLDETEEGVFAIILPASAQWIEEGMSEHEMIAQLLQDKRPEVDPDDKSGAYEKRQKQSVKKSKDGSLYRVIPFDQAKPPTQSTAAQNDLRNTLQAYMKKNKIPWKAIERDDSGTPLTGLLHKFDINTSQANDSRPASPMGPGFEFEGLTPEGPRNYRQRNTPRPVGMEGPGGRPFLWGVRIYQEVLKDKETGLPRINAAGQVMASRSIMTFRVVSSKQMGSGKWVHPGLPGVKLFDETHSWMIDHWNNEMLPQIQADLVGQGGEG